jgi:hypothetical protein
MKSIKRNRVKTILQNEYGSAIINALLAAFVLGIAAVIMLFQSTQINKSVGMIKAGDADIVFIKKVNELLQNQISCDNTLSSQTIGDTIPNLRVTDTDVVYVIDGFYHDNRIRLDRLELVDAGGWINLVTTITKFNQRINGMTAAQLQNSGQTITHTFPVFVNQTAGVINHCLTEESSFLTTIEYETARRVCSQANGEFDLNNGTCRLRGLQEPFGCQPNLALVGVSYDPNTALYSPICDTVFSLGNAASPSCPGADEWTQTYNADGSVECINIQNIINETPSNFTAGSICRLQPNILNNTVRLNCLAGGGGGGGGGSPGPACPECIGGASGCMNTICPATHQCRAEIAACNPADVTSGECVEMCTDNVGILACYSSGACF